MGSAVIRREDWPMRLSGALESARNQPFQWGAHDCALFAADCVLAMTDRDFAAEFRGTYDSKDSAAAVLARESLEQIATRFLGERLASVNLAQRGDVMHRVQGEVPALGICIGDQAIFLGLRAFLWVPVQECSAAWHV